MPSLGMPSFASDISAPRPTASSYSLVAGSVAKIVKLEHAWRRLDGRNDDGFQVAPFPGRSEEHTSELQSLMRISYAVFCLKKKITTTPVKDKLTQNSQ